MADLRFTEEDKQKLIEFLNIIAKHAKFSVDTNELIQYFKSLSYLQQRLLPKIEANIFEIKKVVEGPLPEISSTPEPKVKGKK